MVEDPVEIRPVADGVRGEGRGLEAGVEGLLIGGLWDDRLFLEYGWSIPVVRKEGR